MLVAYIAGPFRSATYYGIWCNVRAAEQVALKYWKLGYAVICPHTNTANFDGAVPKENDKLWLDGDIEIMKRCDVVIAMTSWEKSSGAKAELEIAKNCGLKIIYDELGDGEPSPSPDKQVSAFRRSFEYALTLEDVSYLRSLGDKAATGQYAIGRQWFYDFARKVEATLKPAESGAAQEVSPPSPDTKHIWDSITRVGESRHDYGVCTLTRSACQKLIGERLHGGDTRELKAALRRYGDHDPSCAEFKQKPNRFNKGLVEDSAWPCNCGFSEALGL